MDAVVTKLSREGTPAPGSPLSPVEIDPGTREQLRAPGYLR